MYLSFYQFPTSSFLNHFLFCHPPLCSHLLFFKMCRTTMCSYLGLHKYAQPHTTDGPVKTRVKYISSLGLNKLKINKLLLFKNATVSLASTSFCEWISVKSSMNPPTLNDLLNMNGPSMQYFIPDRAVNMWYCATKKRNSGGHMKPLCN